MNYDKQEMNGAMRSALLQLRRAAEAANSTWEEGEVMLNPRECAELNQIIRDCRTQLGKVEGVSKKYASVAEGRKLVTPI